MAGKQVIPPHTPSPSAFQVGRQEFESVGVFLQLLIITDFQENHLRRLSGEGWGFHAEQGSLERQGSVQC